MDDIGFGDPIEDDDPNALADSSSEETVNEFDDDVLSDQSFDDFESSDSIDEEVSDSVFDSDIFDENEFKDFEDQMESTEEAYNEETESVATTSDDSSSSKGKFVRIVVLGTIVFAVLGFGSWYAYNNFFSGDDSKEVAKATKKKPVKKKKQRPKSAPSSNAKASGSKNAAAKSSSNKKPATTASKPASNAKASTKKPAASKPAATKPKATATRPAASKPKPVASNPGSVNKLGGRTGNTFIIVGSFVDSDMANDFARSLAAKGKSPSIIPPFGRAIYYRVAIASFPTIASAQQNIETFRNQYGRDVWALKY
ncbi:MAG: SPOR domain-containing protein [Bacteroidota bacterium]